MAIGVSGGIESRGLHGAQPRPTSIPSRQPLTFEAKPNPRSPHEFTAQLAPEAAADYDRQQATKARDPASRAFLTVASFRSVKHQIDIYV